jgi:hypothetical protein
VTLAVTEITTCGEVFLGRKVPVFKWHRLPLTGSRWDIRWLIGRRTKPTFCVLFCIFPVFSMAVMEMCFDACGDVDYYFRSGFSVLQGAGVSGYRLPLTGSRRVIRG